MIQENISAQGRLSLVGTGPGDPDLLTVRAVRTIEAADAVIAPKGSAHGASSALAIIKNAVDISKKEVIEIHFPMRKVHLSRAKEPSVTKSWDKAASEVLKRTDMGKRVVFPTLGDPSLYSTAYYLLATVMERSPGLATEVVPGINALSTCSCTVQYPLALGDDLFCVIPATFDDLRIESALEEFDSIALMKVHRCLARIIELLKAKGLLDKSILVERCGMAGQRIFYDLRDAADMNVHYFSTVLVRKRGLREVVEKTGRSEELAHV